METIIKKKYPYLGRITETEGPSVNSFENASPWKEANTAFYWMNFEYPLYHGHTDWEILIVLNDRMIQPINGTDTVLSAGTACLLGPKDFHSLLYPNRKKNQFQGLTFMAKDEYMRSLLNLFSPQLYDRICSDSQSCMFSLSPSFLEDLTNSCLEIQGTNNQSTPQAEEQCNILFHLLVMQFLRQNQPTTSIPNALALFIKSLNNPQLSSSDIKELQANLPYSYSNLTRLFKKYTNQTITQYVNNIKLQHAKELLSTTNMTTLMITNALGFESVSHFNHLFKKQFNITPTQYRKNTLSLSGLPEKDEK
jgi:AraC family cel operon transcriptional repressor